jgi:hypothetical protein
MEECKQRRRKEGQQTREGQIKRAVDKVNMEYLESICDEIMEFQRAERYYFMCMKKDSLDWKENHKIQNIYIEDSKGNIIVGKRQVLKI